MTFGVPARLVATTFALAAFAIAIIAGLAAGNPTRTILINAIIAMIGCNVLGLLLGAVMQRTVDEHLDGYRAANEIPELETPGAPAPEAHAGVETPVDTGVDN